MSTTPTGGHDHIPASDDGAGPRALDAADVPWAVTVTVWLGVVGPTSRAAHSLAGTWLPVLVVGLMAALLLIVGARRSWWVRGVTVLLAAVIVGVVAGEVTALWMLTGLLTGSWVSTGVPPLPRLPPPAPGSTGPVLVLGGVATWQGSDPTSTWQLALPLAAAAALPVLGHWRDGAVHRAVDRFARAVSGAVSTVVFACLSLFLVLVPWSLRLIGHDPLRRVPGWAERSRAGGSSTRPWAPDRVVLPTPRRTRFAGLAIVVALSVGAAAVWSRVVDDRAASTGDLLLDGSGEVAGQEAWFPEYLEDVRWVLDERVALRPFEVYRLRDVRTRHVDVESGVRRSWRVSDCDCPVVTLWLYGGAAAFGLGQRDEHTIASGLARRAAADGIDLEVVNRGVPGQLHWRNAFRFSYDLTYDDPPDLVVFYDGADEVDSALELDRRGLGDTRAPFERLSEEVYDQIVAAAPRGPRSPLVDDLGWPIVSAVAPGEVGRLAVTRYERHRELSMATARSAGVPVRYFWQPTSYELATGADGAGAEVERRRQAFAEARRLLPPDVVEFSDVVRGADEDDFLDEATHGERLASAVADAMYDRLRGALVAAAEERS